jgi:hypothetical protein
VGDKEKQGKKTLQKKKKKKNLTHIAKKYIVLKNVGKIEKFIVDQLRKMLDDELVFPSYQLIQLA